MTHFEYKGYLGTIEPEVKSGTLFGKLAYIRDLVTYEATTLPVFASKLPDYNLTAKASPRAGLLFPPL